MGEDGLLRWLRSRLDPCLIGDDAAVLPAGGPFAVTVDSQIAGVHFLPDLDPAVLARRLLAVNLSDLAATGAEPAYAFLALSTAPGFDHRRFFRAFLTACRPSGLVLAGGDLARNPGGTVATLTLAGRCPEGGRFLDRRGARAGQALWLGGTVGEAAAGLRWGARREDPVSRAVAAAARRAVRRHLQPEPQLALGRWLGLRAPQDQGAAMDVSDGLAIDLRRLCRASGVGAEVWEDALPLPRRFAEICRALAVEPLDLALGGGEDYVLLFTLPDGIEPPFPEARRIGRITRSRRLRLRRGNTWHDLPTLGWDHLATQNAPAGPPGR